MGDVNLPFLTIGQLSALVKGRHISPMEITKVYLDRIGDLDHHLNSYIKVMSEQALAAAHEAEQAIRAGNYLGPLHGIPIGVKDIIYTKGVITTAGSMALADFVPHEDATVVKRLRSAGAIVLGKMNLSEFALGGTIEHPFGTPHNPWDLTRSPGGSSSGSAIAVSASLCALLRYHLRYHVGC